MIMRSGTCELWHDLCLRVGQCWQFLEASVDETEVSIDGCIVLEHKVTPSCSRCCFGYVAVFSVV